MAGGSSGAGRRPKAAAAEDSSSLSIARNTGSLTREYQPRANADSASHIARSIARTVTPVATGWGVRYTTRSRHIRLHGRNAYALHVGLQGARGT